MECSSYGYHGNYMKSMSNFQRICEIMKFHQSAKKLYSSSIIPLNNNKWKVKTLNIPDTNIIVFKQ